ncbi:chromatin modification- protein VID21 [Ascosphaera aggregata]|nr:chromatin modification- protein VID21 [Ascosphaera aggregata]
MSPAAAAALAAQQQRHLPAGAAAAMQASMAASSGSPDPSGLMMKMMPSTSIGVGNVNALTNRAAMASHTSPADSARILREASRLQEQQRLVQSKQQQQHNAPQPHHQFPHQTQSFLPQNSLNRTSPSLAVPKTANGTNRSSSMQGMTFPQAGRAGSPPFPPSASMGSHFGHSSASSVSSSINPAQHVTSPLFATSASHANIPNAAVAYAQNLPNLNTLQMSIQRANPKLTVEQARKIAAEKVQQYHQQRMSQLALNGAVGSTNAITAGLFAQHNPGAHAIHANQHPHGHPNGQIGMRNQVLPARPHTSPGNAAPDAPTMQKVPSQGHPPSQNSPSILSTTSHQAQGYSPLMRTVTTQAHAQVQPQRQFSPSYQQPQQQPQQQQQQQQLPPQAPTTAAPRPMQNQQPPTPKAPAASPRTARPQTIAGSVSDEHAHSATNSSTPPISSTSPPSLPQPSQQQQQ